MTEVIPGIPALEFVDFLLQRASSAADDLAQANTAELTDAQIGNLLARQWSLLSLSYSVYPSWHKGTVFGYQGEFVEADHFVAQMEWDESKQERAIASLLKNTKWEIEPDSLPSLRWQLLADNTVRVAFWWRVLASYSVPVRAAGWNLSHKVLEHAFLSALAERTDQADVARAFSLDKLRSHVAMGRLVVARYCDSEEAQKECIWAFNCGLDMALRMYQEWSDAVLLLDAKFENV